MNGMTPFTLQVNDLTSLSPDRAVEFFRRLLWAEAARVGIGRNIIDAPQCINVGDGGLDAVIEDARPSTDEIIPMGTSGFQIKSSDVSPKGCKKELHQRGILEEPVKPGIARVLNNGGTYILVLFADITNQKKKAREQAIKDELTKLGYSDPKIRLYTANQLICFAEQFPALVTWLKPALGQCQPYSSWSENQDVRSPRAFVYEGDRENWVKEIRQKLRSHNDQCIIFRVIGLPGIGKTRFVFETLCPEDLRNRVLYVRADQFRNSNLYYMLQNDSSSSAILIIDECDLQQHGEFVRYFSSRGSRLAVFTISPDVGNVPPPSLLYELSPLGNDAIKEILKTEFGTLPAYIIHRLAEFADGYPRIVVLLAESYLAGTTFPQEEFLTISDEALMDRLIGGRMNISSDRFRKTKKVLTELSLFQKVGYEGRVSREAEWIAKRININWDDFTEIVREQKKRGIIQGQYYIYVTPFMLRIYLLQEWWEGKGLTKDDFNGFADSIPEEFRADLIERFLDHIPYIASTARGREFAETLLGENGIFADGSLLKSEAGSDFFLKLAEAHPEAARACLKRTVGTWSKEELLKFTNGRRHVVWALEKIAVWRDLFADAARLLLALGEAENETCSNNASGAFADLFTPAPAPVAPTEAPPHKRFPILVEALKSSSEERRMLALRACDQALESLHFTRAIGAEYQGLRKEPQLWMPKTYDEIFSAYRVVWQLLRKKVDCLQDKEQQEAVNILLRRAREIGRIQSLADMVIDTISELSNKPYVDRKNVLEEVVRILYYDGRGMQEKIRQRWEKLNKELTGSDFPSLMKRYVGMNLVEDAFDERGERVDQIQPKIEELTQQAIENNELLRPELDWLVTTEAQNGYRFGYELGKRDNDFSVLLMLLKAQRKVDKNESVLFLGGYFHALFEVDPERWEKELDALVGDKRLNFRIPDLTCRSGLTDRAALRLLDLAEKGVIEAVDFKVFCFGAVINDLSEDVFEKWIEFLVGSQRLHGISTALNLYYTYYIHSGHKRTLPERLTLRLLTHNTLFQKAAVDQYEPMVDYCWVNIGNVFIERYPGKSLKLADIMLEHLGEEGTILDRFSSQAIVVLNEITKLHPKEVWDIAKKYLGPPVDSRAFHIKTWLRGGFPDEGEGVLPLIPLAKIWEWVDEDVDKRAWYLASFVPKRLFRQKGKPCLAREVLVQYGEREDVRNELMANFSTEGWSGPVSLHLQNKRLQLLDFKKDESNENVKHWIDEYVSVLDQDIEQAEIDEERRGF